MYQDRFANQYLGKLRNKFATPFPDSNAEMYPDKYRARSVAMFPGIKQHHDHKIAVNNVPLCTNSTGKSAETSQDKCPAKSAKMFPDNNVTL